MLRRDGRVVYNQGVRQGTPHGGLVPKLAKSGELVSDGGCRGVTGKRYIYLEFCLCSTVGSAEMNMLWSPVL